MKKALLISFCYLIFFTSCSNGTISKDHRDFIEKSGWTIKQVEEKTAYTLPEHEEQLGFLDEQGLNTEELKKHRSLYRQSVILQEKCEGEKIVAIIYSNEDNKIVGAQLIKEAYTPGVSKLNNKVDEMESCEW